MWDAVAMATSWIYFGSARPRNRLAFAKRWMPGKVRKQTARQFGAVGAVTQKPVRSETCRKGSEAIDRAESELATLPIFFRA